MKNFFKFMTAFMFLLLVIGLFTCSLMMYKQFYLEPKSEVMLGSYCNDKSYVFNDDVFLIEGYSMGTCRGSFKPLYIRHSDWKVFNNYDSLNK